MERRTAVVTGASRGGKASAIALAQRVLMWQLLLGTMLKEDQSPRPSGLNAVAPALGETAGSFKVQAFLSMDLMERDDWFPYDNY